MLPRILLRETDMGYPLISSDQPLHDRQCALVQMNVGWLRQALSLLEMLDDATYVATPRQLAPHRAGGHLRHILEFYECFLEGVDSAHIDYDARKRDLTLERSRGAAISRIRHLIDRLEAEPLLRGDSIVFVRIEDASALHLREPYLTSSIGRELLMLSSHTIHHFALIAVTLRLLAVPVPDTFGVAPSTLRYQAAVA